MYNDTHLCCCSVAKLCLTLHNSMDSMQHARLLCPPVYPGICSLMSIESVMLSNHLILCCLLLLPPSTIPNIRVFCNESALHIRWPSIRASVSVLPMNIQSWFPFRLTALISLLSKGTLKSLLQHHSSKASVLQYSAFFMVQLSHLHVTPGKTIASTIRTSVGKVIHCLGLS